MSNREFFRTVNFLGIYASILGLMHGIFQMMQGPIRTDAIFIQAIGGNCQPDLNWHACFPAITLIPNLLVSGTISIIVSLLIMVWASFNAGGQKRGLLLIILSLILLLVGGGFVPVFIGVTTGLAASMVGRWKFTEKKTWRSVRKLWPWTLLLMTLWLPGSWLLGHFISDVMLSMSFFFFIIFDLGLPLVTLLSAYGYCVTTQEII